MQKALEQALDSAECIIENAQQRPPKRKRLSSGEKSLHDKLYDIYVEECGKEPEVAEELTSNVNLLEKLVKRESLPCLVVNLYPGKEGYSLMLKGENEICTESIQLPYQEGEFLEYLDAEELPPVLVDLLEKSEVNLFHRGCVIAEIRDYRQCSNSEPPGYQSRHILLRPTMQTLASDIHSITSDNQMWTQEDKLELESQLILATAEPLCLDPSVSVACTENRLLYNKQKMNTPLMKRNFKRYSTASLNRQQQEPSWRPLPPELRAWNFHKKSKDSQPGQQHDLKLPKAGSCVDTWKQPPCDLAVPSELDVEKYAKQESSVNYNDSQPTFSPAQEEEDDILFRYEAGDQSQTAKLPFMKSLKDPLVSGKRSHKNVRFVRQMTPYHSFTDDYVNIVMPWSNTEVETVVSPFKELVESIPSPIQVPQGSSGSASLSPPSPGREAEWPQATSVQSSVLEEVARHTPPPLSPPSRSGITSSGDSFTPQQASSPRKSPPPAAASMPPSLPRLSLMEVNRAKTLPAATLSTSSSSQTAPASQVKATYPSPSITKVEAPIHAAQTVVRSSKYLKSHFARTRVPVAIRPKGMPSGDQQPQNIQPTVPQAPSQGIKLIFKNGSGVRPTIIQFPPGPVTLNFQQQPQQPQFCQLIPQFQPPIFHIQQPVSQGLSAQRSGPQGLILPTIINPGGAESVLQTQRAVLPAPGSAQTRPGQGLPQQIVQLPSVEQGLPQQRVQLPPGFVLQLQPQQVPLRIMQLPAAVSTVAIQTAQPHSGQQTASQSEGNTNRGPPTNTKF